MPSGGSVSWDLGEINGKLAAMNPRLQARLAIVTEKIAVDAQDMMRSTAPWTDRTSNARNGLFAKRSYEAGTHAIDLYHTVPYGIWLEVRWSGKFAVIVPTIQAMGPRYMMLVKGLLDRMGSGG